MHPNPAFEWTSREEMLEFISRRAFAHVFTATDDGLFVVHAPAVIVDGKIWFHVSRRNRIAEHVAGNRVMISVAGRDAYHSANWYASDDQVSTWHYEAVEVEGDARQLSADELVLLLDRLSETMEERYSPERIWTREKMAPGKFDAMAKAIVGFEISPSAIRGTRKFNQNKRGEDLEASMEGQRSAGRDDILAAMRDLTRDQ